MSNVCISETREEEEDGIGAEPKMSSVAFCSKPVVRNSFYTSKLRKVSPVYPSQRCSEHRLPHHRQWCCLFLATDVQRSFARRQVHPCPSHCVVVYMQSKVSEIQK